MEGGAEPGAILEAVVASRDVPRSLAFHREVFGLDVLEQDASSALLGVAGSPSGRVRVVASPSDPAVPPPVPWEIGPRYLGIYSRDLAVTRRAIEKAGGKAGPAVRYPYGQFMEECVASGVDDVLWTIPNVSPRRPSPALEADAQRLHGELHSAVIVVEDVDPALALFAAAGLKVLFDGRLSGEAFETMIGLPKGASLRLAFLAAPRETPARLELMQFFGVPDAPPVERSVGLRRLVFAAADVGETGRRLIAAGVRRAGDAFVGPAGIEIALRVTGKGES